MTNIYTIGHGKHPFHYFLELLRQYEIEMVCDVRSFARSRWPHFNGVALSQLLLDSGIGYEHLPECGGKLRPDPESLAWGIDRILELAADARVVLMCSESNPLSDHKVPRSKCHRLALLSPPLKAKGARMIHILPDGRSMEMEEAGLLPFW